MDEPKPMPCLKCKRAEKLIQAIIAFVDCDPELSTAVEHYAEVERALEEYRRGK